MFRAILYTQWKWSRLPVAMLTVAAFMVPLLAVQGTGGAAGEQPALPGELLAYVRAVGVFFPILAGLSGLLVGVSAWAADHREHHVYALSLPLPRWHFALLRLGAGLILLLGPVLAVWIGSQVAATVIEIPQGLTSYPYLITLRFGLCALVAFTCFFAISAGTSRTAGIILGSLLALVAIQMLLEAAGVEVEHHWLASRSAVRVAGPARHLHRPLDADRCLTVRGGSDCHWLRSCCCQDRSVRRALRPCGTGSSSLADSAEMLRH